MLTQRLSRLCAIVTLLLATSFARAEDIPFDRAIEVIEAMEKRIQAAEWSVKTKDWFLRDSADPSTKEGPASVLEVDGKVRWDPIARRYHATFDAVLPWKHGAAPEIAGHHELSFDGDIYRSWERTAPGKELPQPREVSAIGAISRNENQAEGASFAKVWMTELGVAFVPPMFNTFVTPITPLSTLLRQQHRAGREIRVTAIAPGAWTIDTMMMYDDGAPFRLVIDYSPEKGCITSAEWRDGSPEVVWRRYNATLREVAPGFWMPITCTITRALKKPAVMKEVILENCRVNPPTADADFVVSFPAGTKVLDHIAGTSFTVGRAPQDEADAIKEFMHQNKVAGSKATQRRSWSAWLLIGNGVLVIGALVALAYRLFRKRSV